MSQPGEHEAPHSLAPVQLEGAGADLRDIEKLRDGSGWRLTFMVVLVTAISVGGIKLLDVVDTREAYMHAAGQLERSDTDPRDAFMRCVLPSYSRSQLTSSNVLRQELERTTERMQAGYAKVLAGCTPQLMHFQERVKDVRAPADMRPRVDAVAKATDELVKSWADLHTFLAHAGNTYDQTQTNRHIDKIAKAWQHYQSAREDAHKALTAQM
jgi:hypothetical protein